MSSSIEECYRLMLGAGADPVQIEVEEVDNTNSFTPLLFLTPAHMVALMLDLGAPYVTPNHQISFYLHSAPIMHLAKFFRSVPCWMLREVPSKIILLIKRRVDLAALDDHGNTCLHELLGLKNGLTVIPRRKRPEALRRYGSCSRRVIQYMRRLEQRDILMLLITAGACVTAVNNSNESVCDVARKYGDEVIWNDVLEECGLDVEKVYSERATDTCRATSVDYGHKLADGLVPKLTFEEYLERREENSLLVKVERMHASAHPEDEELDSDYDSDEEYSKWCEENEVEDCDRIELIKVADDACWNMDPSETESCEDDGDETTGDDGVNNALSIHPEGGMTLEESERVKSDGEDVDEEYHGDQESESGCWDFEIVAFSDNCAEDNDDTLDDATWPARLNDDWGDTHPAKTIDHSLAHDFKGSARQPDKGKKKAD
ncbi:hypothetical protein LTR10_022967 [Elasticomyces elasticus]|uniref:Uncharacterized protein n=1 Tax=Exophiala sideris TaxID=1016849 RepID=A0ABR0J8K3_9EURO|nr:hypothetical protein LTR10_022967 [Elasticomyces elasticus]KAK5022156.1 hypothetical protein LTS07_010235 [Exophiala sideris]KAK5037403.1 hypothetical protein LTR13_004560 [Exophiala sideris]KAK5059065.1 hypothetical protein LTR69_006354 [Exophiala sideris]KAK5182898.1 hypothetical protein LTR44_004608 [Eurotiomycetes sp. CCFEE 6388]